MPFSWSGTGQPQMCTCPKVSLSWECHRCGKINAPWKGSCDCAPLNLNWTPTSGESYVAGVNPFDIYYADPLVAKVSNRPILDDEV